MLSKGFSEASVIVPVPDNVEPTQSHVKNQKAEKKRKNGDRSPLVVVLGVSCIESRPLIDDR